ncbi:MAG: amidohydrolase family protein [Phycisphaerales bacterium]|nr:amidohydrolase family protein [Phycisphaerales bacterium]
MLIAGQLMLPAPSSRVRLARGWVMTDDDAGVIRSVGEGDAPGTPDAGSDDHVITPGFVDAHLHLPQFDSIGQDAMPLLEWLNTVIFPAEIRWADGAFARSMTRRVAATLHSHGTTTVAAYATAHAEGTQAAMHALAEAGIGGAVGQVLMDQEAPFELCFPVDEQTREAKLLDSFARSLDAFPRLEFSLNPRFAISCSPALLRACGELAADLSRNRERPVMIQTHLSETLDECDMATRLHSGPGLMTPADYASIYDRNGLLTPRTLLAHCVHLSASERSLIRAAGSVVAHCPTANTFLQSGTMARRDLVRAGVPVALGSDVAGGPEISMPRVARAMIDAAKVISGPAAARDVHDDPRLPSPARAWWQITGGNADATGFSHAGRLAPGLSADLVLVRPGLHSQWLTQGDPLGTLLYSWDERWIAGVMAVGRWRYLRA